VIRHHRKSLRTDAGMNIVILTNGMNPEAAHSLTINVIQIQVYR